MATGLGRCWTRRYPSCANEPQATAYGTLKPEARAISRLDSVSSRSTQSHNRIAILF